ncbi:unnamed protein product [Peronospora destructor]|uniref:Uncharacterized protein n=1 Tax=Peronospora destructor TaxID=86335 RepID=A0AAV0UGN9_9STRA|nr:unnamed protein product [Peronospora destructor]
MAGRSLGDSISTALRGLLSPLPGSDSAAECEAASLSLAVNFYRIAPSSVLQALQALITMESYSHSLQRYPLVKQAFWEQVLASDLMVIGYKTRKQHLQLQDEQFPRLVLDFSRCTLTAELLETLTEFFAAHWQNEMLSQCQFSSVKVDQGTKFSCRHVPVALKLVRCRLNADSIKRLKSVLASERWTNAAMVRFSVTSLDLSENPMQCDEMMALTDLLDDCRQRRSELPLHELVLENALSRPLTRTNWAAFRNFVGEAFGVNGACKASLKRLSLAKNSLSYHHIGCICSALRCTNLEELSLACTFSLVDPADRKTCWQWLAIGLRPIISCGRRSGLRQLDLSGNPIFPIDSEAWRKSLRNPQAAVLQWLKDVAPQAISHRATTVCCLLSSDAELYSSPTEASPRLRNIEKEVEATSLGAGESKEWEVVGSFTGQHEWLCVVIPAFGVAWTRSKHAMTWEHSEDGLTSALAVLSELVMNDMVASRTTTEALERFVGGFGGRLQSLELRRNAISVMDLDAILAGCQQLCTLDLEGCRVLQLQLLVDALSGALGQNLRKLNLNANLVGTDSLNVLTAALRGQAPDRVPVLQELRVAHNKIGVNGVRHLHAALEANKTLILLELDVPNDSAEVPRRPNDDEYVQLYRTRCMRLDSSFQNELLGVTPLPADRRLTFLLVLNAHGVVLDRGINCAIFSFAADEKRRRILWNITHTL